MRVVDQVWEDLVARKQVASARQISRKLKIPYSSVKNILWEFHKRQILDKIVKNNTNYYKIKD